MKLNKLTSGTALAFGLLNGLALSGCAQTAHIGAVAHREAAAHTQAAQPATAQAGTEPVPVIAGPYAWREVRIGGGGFVDGIDFSPKQPGLIYARTDIGGAYRWNPAARNWVALTDWVGPGNANLLGCESIGVDPVDARRVYLALGTYAQSWAGNGAIVRSTDQGRTWKQTNVPFQMGGNEDGRSAGERLAVDPNNDSILYMGSRNDGLWKSMDYGATWAKVTSFPVTGRTNGIGVIFEVFYRSSGSRGAATPTIYAAVSQAGPGLYRSTDSGATWAAVPGQPAGLLPHHGVLDSAGVLYVTYGNAPGPNSMTSGGVWKYDTKTSVWTEITPVKPGSPGAGNFGYAGLAVDAAHPGTIMVASMDKWATGDDIYRTTDDGLHWSSLKQYSVRDSSAAPFMNGNGKSAPVGHWMGALAIDPFAPGHVLYGTGATLWGSDDVTALDSSKTSHWTIRAVGLEETAVNDLLSPPVGPHLLSAMADIGGFRHDNLAVSPPGGRQNPGMNTTDSMDYAALNPSVVVRVGGGGPQYGAYSTDEDVTWTPFAAKPAGTNGGGRIAVSADGSTLVWAPRGGALSVSRDKGATWTVCTGISGQTQPLADRVNPRKLYALDGKAGKLYVSTDGGVSFSASAASLPGGGSLRAVPGVEGDLWLAAGDHGLLHSVDSGATFTAVSSAAQSYGIGTGRAAPGRTYPALYMTGTVAGVRGVFRSDDVGASWTRINDDQHQYGWTGQAVTGDPRIYGRVYLGTNGRGILYADPASAKRASRSSQ